MLFWICFVLYTWLGVVITNITFIEDEIGSTYEWILHEMEERSIKINTFYKIIAAIMNIILIYIAPPIALFGGIMSLF